MTLTDTLHIVWSAAWVTFMLAAIAFAAAGLGKRFRLYSIATLAILLAFGVLTGLDAPKLSTNLPTPLIGVWERIQIGVVIVWDMVLAVALLRTKATVVGGRGARARALPQPAHVGGPARPTVRPHEHAAALLFTTLMPRTSRECYPVS